MLEKKGFIERVSRSGNALHWRTTDLFKQWVHEFDNGLTEKWPINWIKDRKKQEIAA